MKKIEKRFYGRYFYPLFKMFSTILRATAAFIVDIIADDEMTLPYYSPKNKPEVVLEGITIIGTPAPFPLEPRRRNSFYEGTNGAKAPHSPR